MDYSYDYKALARFRHDHHLSKRDLLEALGSSDYTGITRWLDGKAPVHVTALLRLCNYYSLPLSYFFRDAESTDTPITIRKPDDDSQQIPTDGYNFGGYGPGKNITDPHIVKRNISSKEQHETVEEGLERLQREKEKGQGGRNLETATPSSSDASGNANNGYMYKENEEILRLQLEQSREIVKLEREHHEREDRIRRDCQASFDAERNRLMDIIERQNTELSKAYQRTKSYRSLDGAIAADNG